MALTTLSGHGLAVGLPAGWEGRIFRRGTQVVQRTVQPHVVPATPSTPAHTEPREVTESDRTNPVLHLANFALPAERGDYGSGAVDLMREHHVLVVLFEFGPDSAHTPLFAGPRPEPRPQDFRRDMLQRTIPGQVGWQRFFTENDRAFSVYVVLGSAQRASALCAQGRQVVSAIRIGRRPA